MESVWSGNRGYDLSYLCPSLTSGRPGATVSAIKTDQLEEDCAGAFLSDWNPERREVWRRWWVQLTYNVLITLQAVKKVCLIWLLSSWSLTRWAMLGAKDSGEALSGGPRVLTGQTVTSKQLYQLILYFKRSCFKFCWIKFLDLCFTSKVYKMCNEDVRWNINNILNNIQF